MHIMDTYLHSCLIVQGSILGPVLYAIYVSIFFDLLKLTNFADDNFDVVADGSPRKNG